ncbi:MAG: hypothetical protein R3275_13175 [Saprospiraceae bacterium]|nr:hypothetical protein [Saprospiraceae bacterium]
MAWTIMTVLILSCGSNTLQWEYRERIITQDINPYGIAPHNGEIAISGPDQNLIMHISKEKIVYKEIKDYLEPRRLNYVDGILIIPESKTGRIVLRNDGESYYYPLTVKADAPMAAVHKASRIAIVDYNNHRIIYFDGEEDKSFGGHGINDGQLKYPTDIQLYENKWYVADNMNRRIQVFDMDGNHLMSIGEETGIEQASGLYVYKGGIILTDRKGAQVFWFDHDGNLLQIIDEGFETPSDALVIGNTLYVTDEQGGFVGRLELD